MPKPDLGRIRDLQSSWFPAEVSGLAPYLHAAFDRLGFDEAYIARCEKAAKSRPPQTKVVKDNVWGMIELDPASVRLIDCPVLQRLRGIKQLGFSYLTYPSAEHSRFVRLCSSSCANWRSGPEA